MTEVERGFLATKLLKKLYDNNLFGKFMFDLQNQELAKKLYLKCADTKKINEYTYCGWLNNMFSICIRITEGSCRPFIKYEIYRTNNNNGHDYLYLLQCLNERYMYGFLKYYNSLIDDEYITINNNSNIVVENKIDPNSDSTLIKGTETTFNKNE